MFNTVNWYKFEVTAGKNSRYALVRASSLVEATQELENAGYNKYSFMGQVK